VICERCGRQHGEDQRFVYEVKGYRRVMLVIDMCLRSVRVADEVESGTFTSQFSMPLKESS